MDESSALELLKKHSTSDKDFNGVLEHSRSVQRVALEIARKIHKIHPELGIDMETIRVGSLLHDIGRFECPPGSDSARHGIVGGKILRKEGAPEKFALICERHLGPGITKEDIDRMKLDIPPGNYVPETIEEKIITYADNLLWGDTPQPSHMIVKRFTDELGEEIGSRVKALNDEIEGLME